MMLMAFDKRDADTSLKGAFPPARGAVPRRESRNVREAVKRLNAEAELLIMTIGEPFNHTLQEISERIAR